MEFHELIQSKIYQTEDLKKAVITHNRPADVEKFKDQLIKIEEELVLKYPSQYLLYTTLELKDAINGIASALAETNKELKLIRRGVTEETVF